jgi:hypothetical protein
VKQASKTPAGIEKVLFATPALDGKVNVQYMVSMMQTVSMMERTGVGYDLLGLSGQSLLPMGRNFMVAAFLSRPEFSHLFFIDADMEWKAEDAMRLILDDHDVAMAVGRKKVEGEPQYGVGFLSEQSPVCQHCGCIEVAYGGACFLLISRKAILRMVAKYPELSYESDTPFDPICGLFNPIMDAKDKAYWSEDISFCLRWRAMGEKVWLDPRINLNHWGATVWRGDTMSLFGTAEEAKAAKEAVG